MKASHGTSDQADPSFLQPVQPGDHEPAILKNLQDAISLPHGSEAADVAQTDIASIPERIGYLKEVCGVDFGWGPTSIMQTILEHVHLYSGLSWTVSLVLMGVTARILMIRTTVRGQEMTAKMQGVQPVMAPLREEYKQAVANKDQTKMQTVGAQIRSVQRDAGISMFATFKPLLYQLPLSICGYRLTYAMSGVPVPALESESFLWLNNLSLADPWILPGCMAAMTYLTMSRSIKHNPAPTMKFAQLLQYFLPFVTLAFMHWLPALVQVWFATLGAATYAQTLVLTNTAGRRFFKLPPLRPKAAQASPSIPTSTPASSTVIDVTANTRTIGGMNIRPTGPQPTSTPELAPQQNISTIDKFVDAAKARRDGFKESLSSGRKAVSERAEKKAKQREEERISKYEYQRRQDEVVEREHRNSQNRGSR